MTRHGLIFGASASAALAQPPIDAVMAACYRQLDEHFCPAWGLVRREIPVVIKDYGLSNLLAAHSVVNDQPYIEVYTKPIENLGRPVSVYVSHELMEAHSNPTTTLLYCIQDGHGGAMLYYREPADPVAQAYYEIDGVLVSNFVLPSFFLVGSNSPWDYLSTLNGPLTAIDGNYLPQTPISGLRSLFA